MVKYRKKNKIAVKFRMMGNEEYAKGKFCEALLAYNQSLCFAENKSVNLALCYGNRSAVYFSLGEYEICIQNIELAKNHGYPQEKIQTLEEREKKCKILLQKQSITSTDDRDDIFKLSFPPNPKHPSLANCLELRVNKEYGRHIITNRDLKPGVVIALIDPAFIIFDKRARLHHCSHCIQNSMLLSLIPCKGCVEAMYCSEECMNQDLLKFHQFECGMSQNQKSIGFNFNDFRMLCQMLFHFKWNVDEMQKFFEENRKATTVFDFDLNGTENQNYKNLQLAMLNSGVGLNPSHAGQQYLEKDAVRLIKKHPQLAKMFSSSRNSKFLQEILSKVRKQFRWLSEISCVNNIEMTVKESNPGFPIHQNLRTDPLGRYHNSLYSSINPYEALLNHSCVGSVISHHYNGKKMWLVVRPISAGDQLLTTYSSIDFMYNHREERQLILKQISEFKCFCEPCTKNWPRVMEMKTLEPNEFCVTKLFIMLTHEKEEDFAKLKISEIVLRYKAVLACLDEFGKVLPNMNYFLFYPHFYTHLHALAVPKLFENRK